jgi:hypothetical protein
MIRINALLFVLLSSQLTFGQINFTSAYEACPNVPKGLLETIAFCNTRFEVLDNTVQSSCIGIPLPFGVMGLFDDGKGYFRENARTVATLSGISIAEQKDNPQQQVMAYAKAVQFLMSKHAQKKGEDDQGKILYSVLRELSEIPTEGYINRFAMDAQIYQVFRYLNDAEFAPEHGFEPLEIDLKSIFGINNLKVLSAKKVILTDDGILNDKNEKYTLNQLKSDDYGPAIWNPAPPCNYSSRNGVAVSAITIHTIQGSYAGAISWAQNCDSNVSYHYVIRSSDGQVTQMVSEANKAWHVGSENPYTIGYEHEGYVNNAAWYTEAMYNSSADLSRDIINSGYGIPGLRTYYGASSSSVQVLGNCTKIKGHQHYPNQSHTDPGINWNWEKYYRLINNNPTITTITTPTGNFYDSGGASGNYTNDERLLWLFQPPGANSVALNFSSFSTEAGYDRMFIYNGATINAPLIGSYMGTNSPGNVNSSGGSLLVEFRSDCATVSSGWAATISSTSADNQAPVSSVVNPQEWATQDFTATLTDNDNIGVVGRYYLVADVDPQTQKWSSNPDLGFLNEEYETDAAGWYPIVGEFSHQSTFYRQSNTTEQNTNAYFTLAQDNSTAFMYEWDQNITSAGTNQRAGLHFFCSDPTLPNRGNSYFVFFRETEQKVQIYKVIDDVFSPKTNDNCVVTANTNYTYRVTFDPQSGWIKVYVNNQLVTQWQDIEPLQSGSAISLRTGGCSVDFDNLRVYRSRASAVNVSVGPNGAMRFQSSNAADAGLIRSMAHDEAANWSVAGVQYYKVDWTVPELDFLNDGTGVDIDTTFNPVISANWLGYDEHSLIGSYEVAIGILPSLNNVLTWTPVGNVTSYTHTLSNPIYDQVYHVSLRVINGAGLNSLFVSNGQRLVDGSTIGLPHHDLAQILVYPNPATSNFSIEGLEGVYGLTVYDASGKLIMNEEFEQSIQIECTNWSAGIYQLVIKQGNSFILKKLVIE